MKLVHLCTYHNNKVKQIRNEPHVLQRKYFKDTIGRVCMCRYTYTLLVLRTH